MTALGALQIVAGVVAFTAVFVAFTHYLELVAWWDRVSPRLGRRRRAPVVVVRPIEDVARDARRLGRRHHRPVPGTRFAKLEGLRRAYDGALTESCSALRVEHLLGVLPPGPELDLERRRVERVLSAWGLSLDVADTSDR